MNLFHSITQKQQQYIEKKLLSKPNLEVLAALSDYQVKVNTLSPRLIYLKGLGLYNFLKKNRPKSILEFGMGMTTFILKEYQKNTNCKIVCVDENSEYGIKVLNATQIDADLQIASRIVDISESHICIYYNYNITHKYDLIILDGPNLTVDNSKLTTAKSSKNFLEISDSKKLPQYILIDGRDFTAKDIKENLPYKLDKTNLRNFNFGIDFRYWNELTLL
jgi:hypothetical protein